MATTTTATTTTRTATRQKKSKVSSSTTICCFDNRTFMMSIFLIISIVSLSFSSTKQQCYAFTPAKVSTVSSIATTTTNNAASTSTFSQQQERQQILNSRCMQLHSSFYGKFENFDEEEDEDDDDDYDDDDDDDDDYEEMDDASVAAFKAKMGSLFGDSSDTSSTSISSSAGDMSSSITDDADGLGSAGGGSSSSFLSDDMDDDVGIGSDSGTLSSVDELINYARSKDKENKQKGSGGDDGSDTSDGIAPELDWAKPTKEIVPGVILVANPAKFCTPASSSSSSKTTTSDVADLFGLGLGGGNSGGSRGGPSPSLLAKFGLTRPPPRDLGPDRQADLLPVLVLVEREERRSARAVLLNRRTGYLLGDLEQPDSTSTSTDENDDENTDDGSNGPGVGPILEKFCIQPLWFGGIDNVSSGLDMLHLCPTVKGATQITNDGLYWGGDPSQAQDAMEDPSLDRVMTGFDFKFFVQSTIWSSTDLEKEIEDGVWFPAVVSKNVLFKSRDRVGTQKGKPMWTEIMELLGDEYQSIKDDFYDESSFV